MELGGNLADAPQDAPRLSRRAAQVRDAALTLWARNSYRGTTMKDLAEAVGLRVPSLYNHIGSKEELLEEIMFSTMNELLEKYDAATTGTSDPAVRLRLGTEAHVLFQSAHQREAFIGNREIVSLPPASRQRLVQLRDDYEDRFRQTIEDGAARGIFHVRSQQLATYAVLGMCNSVAAWFDPGGPLSVEEVAREYGLLSLQLAGYRGETQSRPR
ncbi:MAG: TetR family transcriptional regulator [Streptosporangiales bacterium]|nr:TetR family transcriptional regulator [Streptosporangiales bacterium]